ncbi:acetate/propionate family kinase [Roseovarius autotrophicus]|uniref:acetate/propionate family kinase n=1 Tax=Roseovarius autotrophicus TaxID=2824121 RepID=UPI0019E1BD59|nr:acetate kinase [Roseovarius autotrophicus]MBE0455154.1 acetate kinase [Roseovarius sp.]
MTGGPVLVVNAGSSSIKLAVFEGGAVRLSGLAEGIGGTGRLRLGAQRWEMPLPDHATALPALLAALSAEGLPLGTLRAAAHRVVHGGAITAPARITPETLTTIRAAIPLAPLHNPHSLAAIETLARLAPDLPQTASFDTAFHATNPEVATRYALPSRITARGIRRYGFHGISFAALTESLPRLSGAALPARLLALHLGNGASLCAIRDGRSVATTMGYSPLSGLTMGTRAGEIDGNAVLRLAEEDGIAATRHLLNHDSGLKGLSGGLSDMRTLMETDTAKSRFAIEHFCYWAVRQAGSLIAAMGGVDALAFTGGIGENAAPVRARIVEGLGWLGARLDPAANAAGAARLHAAGTALAIWIVPAAEESRIAADALALLDAR